MEKLVRTSKNVSLRNEKHCYWHSKNIPETIKQEHKSNGAKSKIIKTDGAFPEIELKTIPDIIKLNSLMINKILKNEADVRV